MHLCIYHSIIYNSQDKETTYVPINRLRAKDVTTYMCICFVGLVAQSCATLCDPMDCSPTGSSVHGDSPSMNTRVGCHAPLQGIFSTQGSNPGLQHCRRILYHLSQQGSPYMYIYVTIGKGSGNTLWYSCLENPMDRGVWRAIVHGVTKRWT